MTAAEIIALVVAGLLVGFINTLAGGGSIVSLSLLMFLGLPANIANGTNRIGILLQNIAAVSSFRQQRVLDWRKGKWLAFPTVIGSLLGAWIAVDLNEDAIEKAIAVIMLVMLFVILFKPQRFIRERIDLISKKVTLVQVIIFFFIGLYGGFIQMGVGYFLLAALVFSAGYELVKANAIKVLIVLLYTPFAMIIFIINNQVNWGYGLILGTGTIVGGWIASRLAVSWGANFVRWVIVAVILLTASHIFGIVDIKTFISGFLTNR